MDATLKKFILYTPNLYFVNLLGRYRKQGHRKSRRWRVVRNRTETDFGDILHVSYGARWYPSGLFSKKMSWFRAVLANQR